MGKLIFIIIYFERCLFKYIICVFVWFFYDDGHVLSTPVNHFYDGLRSRSYNGAWVSLKFFFHQPYIVVSKFVNISFLSASRN